MNAETLGEVAGLLLVAVLVAVVAWLGRRQELRRVAAGRARREAERASRELAGLPAPVDPWPDAVDPDELSLRDLVATWAGAR